jgi:hypothetical protein
LAILQKFYRDSKVSLLASLNLETVELRDDDPDLYALLKDASNDNIYATEDIGVVSARFKQKLFNYYESKLNENREPSALKLDDLLDASEGFSSLQYLGYLLSFIKVSLLTSGKIMSQTDFSRFLSSDPESALAI